MATYSEKNSLSLLTGATDPDGDPILVRKINGVDITVWPHSVALTAGSVSVAENGVVTFDDGDDTSGHPAAGVSAANGSFTFTLWDGSNESPTYTSDIQLTGVAVSGGLAFVFGTKTPAGEGGIPLPVGATAISGGTASGYLISGSRVVPATNGSADAGTLTFAGTSETWTMGLVAGYSVRTTGELTAAVAATAANDEVRLRASLQDAVFSLSGLSKSGVKITSDGGATVRKATCSGVSGITFLGVDFADPNVAKASPTSGNAMLVCQSGSNLEVDSCAFDGLSPDGYLKFLPAIYCTGQSTINVHDCTADNVFRLLTTGIAGTGQNIVAIRFNTVDNVVEQAIRIADPESTDIEGNTILSSISRHGKQLVGTITGTFNVGDDVSKGSGGALQGGQVQGVGSGFINILYNAHEFPQTGTYTGPTGSINVTAVTTGYDPVHSDGIQVFNPNATKTTTLRIVKNMLGRGTGGIVDFPNISDNDAYPGIRIQQQSGVFGYDFEIDQNILWADHLEAMQLDGGKSGTVRNNLCLYSSRTAADAPCRMRIGGSTSGVTFSGNVGDSGGGGRGIIDQGSNINGGGGVDVLPGAYATEFPSFSRDAPPHVLADFAPAPGQAVANAGAGPVDASGNWRTLP